MLPEFVALMSTFDSGWPTHCRMSQDEAAQHHGSRLARCLSAHLISSHLIEDDMQF